MKSCKNNYADKIISWNQVDESLISIKDYIVYKYCEIIIFVGANFKGLSIFQRFLEM